MKTEDRGERTSRERIKEELSQHLPIPVTLTAIFDCGGLVLLGISSSMQRHSEDNILKLHTSQIQAVLEHSCQGLR